MANVGSGLGQRRSGFICLFVYLPFVQCNITIKVPVVYMVRYVVVLRGTNP
jgi:hypothetical protein